jgi:hypothetical protein
MALVVVDEFGAEGFEFCELFGVKFRKGHF